MSELETIREIIRQKADIISDINRKIWGFAEGGYDEYQSCAVLTEALKKEGFDVKCPWRASRPRSSPRRDAAVR